MTPQNIPVYRAIEIVLATVKMDNSAARSLMRQLAHERSLEPRREISVADAELISALKLVLDDLGGINESFAKRHMISRVHEAFIQLRKLTNTLKPKGD